jgi:hypothetical protein
VRVSRFAPGGVRDGGPWLDRWLANGRGARPRDYAKRLPRVITAPGGFSKRAASALLAVGEGAALWTGRQRTGAKARASSRRYIRYQPRK